VISEAERWNHNIHYHRLILDSVPAGARDALDVGCGEGMLARRLRRVVPNVMGIDLDQPSIDLAKGHSPADGIDYRCGDFLTYPFAPESFDVIASVATVHHMDAAGALTRMRELLRPGGTLSVVGLARSRLPAELPIEVAAALTDTIYRLTKSHWEHPSPTVWPPPQTYAGMRCLAARLLPDARYRRHLLWRYSIIWTKLTP
jgi:2-polyprenyl-3-methyl-5-hydroxy-6-metoxy-1,4-benzoquinol methylase